MKSAEDLKPWVETWPDEAYKQAVKEIAEGCMARTHLALLQSPEGKKCRGYIKHFVSIETKRGLFNEWFSYHIMRALGIPQPRCAIMRAPFWGTDTLAWSFVSIEPSPENHGTPKQIYDLKAIHEIQSLARRLLNCSAIPGLAAADQLIANGDRNMGNLVFTGKDTFLAIDHSNALHGPGWENIDLWRTQQPSRSILIDVFEIASKTGGGDVLGKIRNALVAAADVVQETYYARQDEVRTRLGTSSSGDAARAMDMAWWRCGDLGTWMRQRLQVI